ncbi:MAG TPA: hypothetical protein VFS77_01730 [Pyrinomonadaceae bacterium]|nr:hypothetical protein [Pyrinomonadaceae bacterium]
MNRKTRIAFGLAIVCLALSAGAIAAAAQTQKLSEAEKQTLETFEKRVKEYLKLRNQIKEKLPAKLSKDSTPEQIHAYMTSFEDGVRAARAGAKRGELFVPEVATYIRTVFKEDFKGRDRVELRKTILQAETQGVPVRVNYPYPEEKEFTEMPPTLLLKLPQLPQEMRYRFVGTNLLLVDRENNVIVDYMPNALP